METYARFLKTLDDARAIRHKLLECFERASNPDVTEAQRKALLTFVVVGGGPTRLVFVALLLFFSHHHSFSVEFAGELYDFITQDIRSWYPDLVSRSTRILLVSIVFCFF